MSKVRVALIGAGGMANRVHYPSLASFDDVELVGLCDLDAEKLTATAEKFHIENTFSDYREMLERTKPDAAYALMPPHVLFDVAMDVMQAGCHLFIEKPPGITTFQAQCLGRMAEQKGLVTGVGFQRRYHPMVRHCHEAVSKKGQPNQVNVTFIKDAPVADPHPYYRGAIGILHCDAIHAVDSLRYYCGLAEIRSVSSVVRELDSWYYVSFNALVHFENDAVGVLQTNWRAGRRFFKLEFHTAGASAFADIDAEGRVWFDNEDDPSIDTTCTDQPGTTEEHVVQGFCAQARAFIDGVKAGRTPHNSLQDAAKTMQLADAIFENAANRKKPG